MPEINESLDTSFSISVVIPCFNHGHFVCEAIESVLAQTYSPRAIIVVDDGSTDNTRERVESFGSTVCYIFQPNRGLSAARNAGVRAARGNWIAFLDADDLWLPEKLADQVRALSQSPDAVLAYTSIYRMDQEGIRAEEQAILGEDLWPKLRTRNFVCGSGSAVLVRKDVLEAADGFNENLDACEDWDLWARLAIRSKFVAVRKPLTVIRTLTNSLSADQARMLRNTEQILEPTMLAGLEGWNRVLWRRRIRAAALYRAACGCNDRERRHYLAQSLWQWPIPDVAPGRWMACFRMLLGRRQFERCRYVWRKVSHNL